MSSKPSLEREVHTHRPFAQVWIGTITSCHGVGELVGIGVVEVNQIGTRDVDTSTLDTNITEPLRRQVISNGQTVQGYTC